ncbi:E3 UFM1-protein ligase 1 homolog [Chenopodium quinoa]|uniref:E3 UFM1-protein ligase 1 homolog n=1 Tax=Chenopodium quinoa TaxID=63459 RepID=UPI000B77415F|nr:E3 UFM1-protein ligase 1 homolog [Chenopodium quinoa]
MDEELLELQKQFEFAQQAKSSIRLSDRNVVELVQKLHDLQIIDFDLLHTVSGKEYITPEQLRLEICSEVKRLGRVSLIDLTDSIGVDLYHVERQAQVVVSDDPELMLIQGEIISKSYWDTMAEEINERLQECSQIAVAELAAQLQVGSELISSMLESRLGTLIKGRLEGGQLYTPAYVARVNAMVRGAARGITVPMNLSALWSSLQQLLQGMDGATGVAVDNSFFQTLFNGLLKEVEILGSLRAGVHWTPAVFASAQKEFVDSFLSQNSFISYDSLQKLGIPQPMQYLQSRYPEGIPLVTMFIHPSMIEMLDAAIEDAVERNSWIDSLTVLPSLCDSQDAYKILSLCPSVQSALKSNRALIVGESYVLSDGFIKDVFTRLDKEMQTTIPISSASKIDDEKHPIKESKGGNDSGRLSELNDVSTECGNRPAMERGSKKKKGKSSGNPRSSASESDLNKQEPIPSKSKRNQRKGKDSSVSHVSESKRSKEDSVGAPSEEWIINKVLALVPEFEEQDVDDRETILKPLANQLRPMLVTSWNERRRVMLAENSDRMKRVLDNLQKKLDESYMNMQLYEKALDLFEDDQATFVVLHRHLLRTTGASIADMLLFNLDVYNKLKNGIPVEESQNSESVSLSSGERTSIAKSLHGSLSVKAVALVESVEGKQMDIFMTALATLVEESGLFLKKLDKKLEKALLHSYRKDLTSQVSMENDPVLLLPKVVSLLYLKIHNKALQAPGRAMSIAVSRLKDKLDDSAFKTLMDYHSATVALLSILSASTNDEDDCASDRIATKKELLESLMPTLKGLVLGSTITQPQVAS